MLIIALLVRFKIGSPVLFRQVRPGLHGKPFTLYKFRTMTDERDENGNLLPDGERLTRLGRFLRKTSMDELPELFNVIKGERCLGLSSSSAAMHLALRCLGVGLRSVTPIV